MHENSITFRHSVYFLRCISNFHQIPKDQKENISVKDILNLPDTFTATSGYVEDETLYLTEKFNTDKNNFNNAGMIVLSEYLKHKSIIMDHINILPDIKHQQKLSLFKLRLNESVLDISLNYSEFSAHIGEPKRDNFKLGELHKDEEIRITFNGKNDLYKQRYYLYFDFIFLNFVSVKSIHFLPPAKISKTLMIHGDKLKHVKLLKELY